MAREYFCAYHDLTESLSALDDAECGRLFRACLIYSKTGEVPELAGNERFVWPMMKGQIDRDAEKYDGKCERNRTNAKRANASQTERTQANGSERKRTVANASQTSQEKEKEEEKDKEKEKEEVVVVNTPTTGTDDGHDDNADLMAINAEHAAVFDAAERAGFPKTAADLDKATALMADYSPTWVLEAVRRASDGTQNQRCWRYVAGILKDWRRKGGMDSAERPQTARAAPGVSGPRKVTAQEYAQRDYTQDELDKLFDL